MPSTFTWLDYSEAERRKALDVADAFRNRDTRDELGLGAVRDAFANILFPGTTTIQTRARYFLFIPYIYLNLEKRHRQKSFNSKDELATAARREELSLIRILKSSEDPDGTIGIDAGDKLKRLPSNVYWYGMGAWGVRRVDLSQDEYHKHLFKFGPPALPARNDENDGTGGGRPAFNWHPELQSLKPTNFPQNLSFLLTSAEADFLKERIKSIRSPLPSMLAVLADGVKPWTKTDFAWEHPLAVGNGLPPDVTGILSHARNFSEIIHGAALLYNLLVARRFFATLLGREEKIGHYEEEMRAWGGRVAARADVYSSWDRQQFWQIVHKANPTINPRTVKFVDEWLDLVFSSKRPADVAASESAQLMILEREKRHKPKGMARLLDENALRQWSGAAGAGQLDFRWGVSQRILTDILTLVEGSNA